jgi:hypothetical protein
MLAKDLARNLALPEKGSVRPVEPVAVGSVDCGASTGLGVRTDFWNRP